MIASLVSNLGMLVSRSGSVTRGVSLCTSRHSPLRCRNTRRRFKVSASVAAYDYIIVGGGASGCLLANRLSEDDANNVLLLEAGSGKQHDYIRIPAGIARLFKSEFDWNLYSTPQEQLQQKSIYLARGKVIGGSTSTNATLYHRGTAKDYDDWGIDGWTAADVLPWFLYAEDYIDGDSIYHNSGGLMRVEHVRYENRLYDFMLNAARELGLKYNPDFNDWSRPQEGFGTCDVTQKRGVRADAFKQFLRPALKRENLHVISDARTSKIVFDTKCAVGVEYRCTGAEVLKREASLNPNGEVILCAGAIHSPHLLMLSGVGPQEHLRENDIAIVQDLPGVGQHLQDHPAALSAFYLKPEYEHLAVTELYDDNGNVKRSALWEYLFRKRGPLTTTVCDRGAFITTPGHDQPNVQLRFNSGYALDPDGVDSFVKFGQLLNQGGSWPGGITIQAVACRARSEGVVTLASNDPLVEPAVNIGYLTDPDGDDLRSLREGLRISRRMVEKPALNGFIKDEGFPGAEKETDEDLDAYIRKTLHSANALVGTCRMGSSAEDGSVVSGEDLRVHGVEGLRVIDASVMPRIIGGQTGAPTVMIAERGADMIRNNSS